MASTFDPASADASPRLESFDDVDRYESEIPLLVPGYELLHAMVPLLVRAELGARDARALVVGCGAGHELVALARANPRLVVDALDPAPAMVAAAERNVALAGLHDRIAVRRATMHDLAPAQGYDVVVALLVAHFVPDDGARAAFFSKIGALTKRGGVVVVADLVDDGPFSETLREGQLGWAREAGMEPERLATMRRRLAGGFAALSSRRLATLLGDAGLAVEGEIFRCFGVAGTWSRKRTS